MHGPNQQADDRLELIVIDPKIRTILQRPFPQEMILPDRQNVKADGFVPSYIPWDQITARLDEAFGSFWSFEIVKWEIVMNVEAVVHGRLTVWPFSKGYYDRVPLTKDGIGTKILTVEGNRFTQIGDDIKSASSEALKRAAVLLGVGVQLYQRGKQVTQAVAPLTATNA